MPLSGVHRDFYSHYQQRLDLIVDVEVWRMTKLFVQCPEVVGRDCFTVDEDVQMGSDQSDESSVRVFRLRDCEWTQVVCRLEPPKKLELGKVVSRELSCRCVHIEETDDAWGGHALFEKGIVLEINWEGLGEDFANRLGIPEAKLQEGKGENYGSLFYSSLGTDERGLDGLAQSLGFWVSDGSPVWTKPRTLGFPRSRLSTKKNQTQPVQEVERLDLLYSSK